MFKHTIVGWDCSFRNFFHLLPSLAEQDFDLDHLEVIIVEQRPKAIADSVCHAVGTKSLHEIADQLKDRLNVRILYLNEPDDEPYHPGKLINEGLREASGDIISVMDIDILVPENFLQVLDRCHHLGNRVYCMHRYDAAFPCGVSADNWTNQIIDYDLILNISGGRGNPIPEVVMNKAPLLSTRRENWDAISGYDAHRAFSTAYTVFGRDVSARFELLLGAPDLSLPVACVHPWHPTEVNRQEEQIQILYGVQMGLIDWSQRNKEPDVTARDTEVKGYYQNHGEALERAIAIAEAQMLASTRPGR